MKKTVLFFVLLLPVCCLAQPAGYYLPAAGLSGQPLRIALMGIIRAHTALSYTPGLWNAYYTTDKKPDGKLWDVYSDIPGGTPAYEYTLGTNQCSGVSPSAEDGCYNREHTWPQSKFGSAAPMQTDLFIVYPCDYYVNSNRGDYPYGIVGTATKTFTNHSKIGNNIYPGAPSGNCYEPNDSFKGDLARNYFYVSTCYRNDSASFVNWEMATQVNLNPWAIQMLLEWHHNDPVSQKEIDRNDSVYNRQGNRNPFIDHPEYADCIWGTGTCLSLQAPTIRHNHTFSVFPNPASSEISIYLTGPASSRPAQVSLYSVTGQKVSESVIPVQTQQMKLPVSYLPRGTYLIQLIGEGSRETQRLVIE